MAAKFNLDFYTGADYYSDGDIEDELLEIVKQTNDYHEILANDDRWPILYSSLQRFQLIHNVSFSTHYFHLQDAVSPHVALKLILPAERFLF